MHRRNLGRGIAAGLALTLAGAGAAGADGLNLRGSLGEGGFKRYVAPLTNPYYNESPYITTELRPVYAYHAIPREFLTRGGDVSLFAAQARLALTDRLGIIATKDGWAKITFNRALPDEDGFMNIAGGLKFAVYSDPEAERILSVGVRYEAPVQNLTTARIKLQGAGDGYVDAFLTGAATVKGDLGVQASVGTNVALDQSKDTSTLHYSLHVDHETLPGLYPLVELNGFTPFARGERLTGPLKKTDLVDFGDVGASGTGTTVTVGAGVRWRIADGFQLGVGAEAPITDKFDSVFDWRLYADLVAHL